jgi:hypothetical protein
MKLKNRYCKFLNSVSQAPVWAKGLILKKRNRVLGIEKDLSEFAGALGTVLSGVKNLLMNEIFITISIESNRSGESKKMFTVFVKKIN